MRGMGIANPMFFIGVVENNLDESNQGRVQVRAFGIHGNNEEIPTALLPWAICVAGNYDVNHTPPPINSFVFGMFLDGDEGQHPMILGTVPGQYTEKHDPKAEKWGIVPPFEPEILSMMGAPRDVGQVQKSKLVRGEDLDTTYIGPRFANAVQRQKIPDSDATWNEPPPAYAAKYPYNRVIETARHSIEIDDTPNAERITITHNSGSYIEIDAIGSFKERAQGDRYEVNIGTKHESSGHSVVTINGNSHVYVKGNKTEEIMGNYKRIVHGENEVTSGGQSYYNAGGHLFLRGASTKIEGNAESVTIFGKNEVAIEGEKQINMVSGHIKNTATLTFSAYANKAIRLTSAADTHIYAIGSIINTALGTSPVSLTPVVGSAGSQTSRGFSVTAPTFNALTAHASFSGMLNSATMNTGALICSTGIDAKVGNFGAVNTAVLAAPLPISSSPGSPCKPGPGRLIGVGAPTVALPIITPPGVSSILPSFVPSQISGVVFPQGNGPGFAATVLTSPLEALTGFDINVLPEGGLGMPRIQMPQPASHGCSIVPGGYFSLGYALGVCESLEAEE